MQVGAELLQYVYGFFRQVEDLLRRRLGIGRAQVSAVGGAADQFALLVPWLMLNHEGLDVLIHPLTDDAYTDHADRPLWLGEKLKLRLEYLKPDR